ncbi:hypothetical protein BRLA_c008950 [Brevibacillus laterosporus LMG 15441]|uniref:Uncharacterized protein n=1 Tax=Brevibacillus laterosporus LMG 15441 TaxID=1042163 RepID=A0A075R1C0_BRELA|nr:hypothetical protein BRLA_c008950 [Brevibacillus laterosporus LMG 15441]
MKGRKLGWASPSDPYFQNLSLPRVFPSFLSTEELAVKWVKKHSFFLSLK